MLNKKENHTDKTEKANDKKTGEILHYVRTLKENNQVSCEEGPLAPGETHRETVTETGEKRIKRERFSLIKK